MNWLKRATTRPRIRSPRRSGGIRCWAPRAGAAASPVVAFGRAPVEAPRGEKRDDGRRNLSAGHDRLRAHAPVRRLAEARPDRSTVRHQLRGGRREQHPARRRRLRSLPVRDRRRRALAGHAAYEHGVDLRIRLPGRLLAAASPVHRTLGSGDGLRGGDGDGAQSRGGRGDERGRVGDRHPRAQVDRLSRHGAGCRGAPHRRGGARPHRGRGRRPLGFYQGRSSINTIRLGMEEGGFVYCADTYADDLPYWLEGPRGPQL